MDYTTGVIWGSLVMGGLCGLLPLIVGIGCKQKGSAIFSFLACVAAGFILGIIAALPIAIIATVVIAIRKK